MAQTTGIIDIGGVPFIFRLLKGGDPSVSN
jgi:hypothetical protein